MAKQVGNSRPLAINPDIHRPLETSFNASMASGGRGWHTTCTVLTNCLYNHCQVDPVLKAVCNHLHGDIQESNKNNSIFDSKS